MSTSLGTGINSATEPWPLVTSSRQARIRSNIRSNANDNLSTGHGGKPVNNPVTEVQRPGFANSDKHVCAWPYPERSADNESIDRLTHKFSPGGQGTLYPVKLFGIMSLFERCHELSTTAARSTMNAVIR